MHSASCKPALLDLNVFGFFQRCQYAGQRNLGYLSDSEQLALIKRYQSLKEMPEQQRINLQQRMDWFTQLPEAEKQRMRETWQMMSSQERKELGARMQKQRQKNDWRSVKNISRNTSNSLNLKLINLS